MMIFRYAKYAGRWAALSIAVCVLFTAWAIAGVDTPAKNHLSPRHIRDKIRKLEVFDFREKELLEKLTNLEKEINDKKGEIRRASERLQLLDKKAKELTRTLGELRSKKECLEKRLGEHLVYIYKYARRGYMRALCTASDLDEFRKRVKYIGILMAEDSRQLSDLFIQQVSLNKKLKRIKEEVSRTDALRKQEGSKLASLGEDVERKIIKLMRIHEEKEFYRTAVEELEAIGPKFKETIVKVEDRKAAVPMALKNISELKGRLPIPLRGTIVRGRKLFKSNHVYLERGIFIRAREGAKVRAILPGRVEFSGKLKGYGQVIIINHGSRFFTISALLSKRNKEEGDLVRQSEIIGEVGSAVSRIGSSLYFEIRRGGKNLDPLKWLKIGRVVTLQ